MIFAAGLGTRLKPITETTPKALVEIAGKPLIEHVMRNLVASGFNDIVVNVHHFADKIENWAKDGDIADFIRKNNVRIAFSDERKELLETGGGIAHAASMLRSGNPRNKFLVHNVDILSNANLNAFNDHCQGDYDAMLLVSRRKTARYLVFNSEMRLVGWINIQTKEIRTPFEDIRQELENMPQDALDTDNLHLRAFAGIHLIDTKLLDMMTGWPEKFSIIDFYLSICHSTNIKAYTQTGLNIVDVGKLDTLALAEEFIKKTH
jgi:NDP-sugar pyrophosphorylase family protein